MQRKPFWYAVVQYRMIGTLRSTRNPRFFRRARQRELRIIVEYHHPVPQSSCPQRRVVPLAYEFMMTLPVGREVLYGGIYRENCDYNIQQYGYYLSNIKFTLKPPYDAADFKFRGISRVCAGKGFQGGNR